MDPPRIDIKQTVSETMYFKNNIERLLDHMHPMFHCLKLMVKILLHGPDGSGKRMMAKLAAENLNIKFCEEHVVDMLDENIVATEKKIRSALSKYSSSAPCLIYLAGYELFCYSEEPDVSRIAHTITETLNELSDNSSQPTIFIASTDDFNRVYKTPLSEIFHHDIELRSPTLEQAKEILLTLASRAGGICNEPALFDYLDEASDYYLGKLIHCFVKYKLNQSYSDCQAQPSKQTIRDAKKNQKDGTRWLDIGGLSHVKDAIIDTIQLSINYPQLRKSGLKRTGILLYGPPGTGKTLLAKAVANECRINFISVKGPELLNEYVGQSEDNVRKLFQRARDESPSVIFFDEIDSLAPNRGQAGDSGGVMDRLVSQLLAEMDGVGKCDGVFVIGATNRKDLVDPSLLRPGRFDKVLEVPLPSKREDRLQILGALTRKMQLSQDVSLAALERAAAAGMSGADFQGMCSRALQRSFDRCIQLVEAGHCQEEEAEIITTMGDFIESLEEMGLASLQAKQVS